MSIVSHHTVANESSLQDCSMYSVPPTKPLTIVVVGTHCSGKSTISKRLADSLGIVFDPELGDVLRDKTHLAADGHKLGDGSGAMNIKSWDDQVFHAECQRDEARRGCSRVVETHHFGNLAWAAFRQSKDAGNSNTLIQKYRQAIERETHHSLVILVNLQIEVDVSMRRRQKDNSNRVRVPLLDEARECDALHQAIQYRGFKLMDKAKPPCVPVLHVNNSEDGEAGIQNTLESIVEFVKEQQWHMSM